MNLKKPSVLADGESKGNSHTQKKKIATSIAETKNGYLVTVKLNHNISIYRLPGEHITAKQS